MMIGKCFHRTTGVALSALLVAVLLVAPRSASAASMNGPSQYFGGTSNEAYMSWVAEYGGDYDYNYFLASAAGAELNDDGVALHWRLDEERLYLAVAARATGFVAFGLSENGGMTGSDIVAFEASAPDVVKDMYVQDVRVPVEDECQDWKLIRSSTDDGFLIFEAHRLLETGDNQDRRIFPDAEESLNPTRIIAAWGDDNSGTVAYHGPNRARGQLRWLTTDPDPQATFTAAMASEADGFFEIRANNHPIAPIDTEYVNFCVTASELTAEWNVPADWNSDEYVAIGFEPIVDQRSERHVHHFVVYASYEPNDDASCNGSNYFQFLYGWT